MNNYINSNELDDVVCILGLFQSLSEQDRKQVLIYTSALADKTALEKDKEQ